MRNSKNVFMVCCCNTRNKISLDFKGALLLRSEVAVNNNSYVEKNKKTFGKPLNNNRIRGRKRQLFSFIAKCQTLIHATGSNQ